MRERQCEEVRRELNGLKVDLNDTAHWMRSASEERQSAMQAELEELRRRERAILIWMTEHQCQER